MIDGIFSVGIVRDIFTFFFTLFITILLNEWIIKKEIQKDKTLNNINIIKEIIEDLNKLEFQIVKQNINARELSENFLLLFDKCLIIFNHKKEKREELDSIAKAIIELLYGDGVIKDKELKKELYTIIDKIRNILFNYIKKNNNSLENINSFRKKMFNID